MYESWYRFECVFSSYNVIYRFVFCNSFKYFFRFIVCDIENRRFYKCLDTFRIFTYFKLVYKNKTSIYDLTRNKRIFDYCYIYIFCDRILDILNIDVFCISSRKIIWSWCSIRDTFHFLLICSFFCVDYACNQRYISLLNVIFNKSIHFIHFIFQVYARIDFCKFFHVFSSSYF